ncbi:hypothetical protein FBR00_11725 [Anaerolineae bacterium CFX4]|nr:hypothetical protein [Anaerolineae bacterium CFX4]
MTEAAPRGLRGSIATLMSSNVLGALLAFGLSVLIGRAAGEAGLGVYAASVAWVFPLGLLVDAGVGTLISRDLAYRNNPPTRAYLAAGLRVRLLIGLPLLAAVLLAAPVLAGSEAVARGIAISAPLIVINPLVSSFTAVFRSQRRMRPAAALNVGMLTAQVVLTAIVFGSGYGVETALWVNTLTSAAQLAAGYLIWRVAFAEAPTGEVVPTRDLLLRALPFAIAAVIAALQMRVNLLILEQQVSQEAAGTYAASARRWARRGLIAYGLSFGALVWLFAYVLIGAFFGEQFNDSAEVLRILAWSLLPMSLKYLRGLYWYAHKREDWVNTVSLLALAGQGIAAFVLIPIHGPIGAAWVALVSESIAAAVLWFAVPKKPQSVRVEAAG